MSRPPFLLLLALGVVLGWLAFDYVQTKSELDTLNAEVSALKIQATSTSEEMKQIIGLLQHYD